MSNKRNIDRLARQIALGRGLDPQFQGAPKKKRVMKTKMKSSFVNRGRGRGRQIEKAKALAEKIEKIKNTPRPTVPRPTPKEVPDHTNDEILNQEVEDYEIDMEWAEVRARSFLDDMLIGAAGDIDPALFNAVRDLITEKASYETILAVIREFEDDVKDYYLRRAMFSTQGVTRLFMDLYKALSGEEWRY